MDTVLPPTNSDAIERKPKLCWTIPKEATTKR
jgi:hypothetical protein